MSKIKIFSLGGLNENGKNMYVVNVDEDIFVFDAGLKYDNDLNLGIDYIVPNIDYLVKKNKLEDVVNIVGFVEDKNKLLQYYQDADIFCMPSYGETFGIVYVEAMSQGCSCIAYEVGGATREMLNKECGVIVPDGDNELFQSCLCKLMNDVTCRESLGDNAIIKSQEFTKETFAKNWLKYINEVITKYNDKN